MKRERSISKKKKLKLQKRNNIFFKRNPKRKNLLQLCLIQREKDPFLEKKKKIKLELQKRKNISLKIPKESSISLMREKSISKKRNVKIVIK